MKRQFVGWAVGVLTAVALGAALLPLRTHLSIATSALVLVIPVVAEVITGGFVAGLVSVAAGFLVYDLVFIPPYWTLTVSNGQYWVALGVYAVVMVLIARVVANLDEARSASQARETNAHHLFELSELLLGDKSVSELGRAIVDEMHAAFQLSGASLTLSVDGHLEVVASSKHLVDAAGEVLGM